MRKTLFALALVLGTATLHASVKVDGLTFNTQLMLEMYNVASQNNNVITSYPANLNPGVVTVRVTNLDTVNAATPCFQVVVNEPGSACGKVVDGPVLQVKDPIPAGKTVMLNANSFIVSGTYNGKLCQAFEDEMKSQFDGGDVSKLQSALQQFLKRRFQVCLIEAPGCTGPGSGSQSCADFEIFTSAPGSKASCSVLIYPHNNGVPNGFPNFLWTPAIYPGKTGADISYTLEVLEDGSNEAFTRIDIPAGQTYYQWGANDRTLLPGRKYQFRVISKLAASGQLIGGQNGQGWNTMKWFEIAATKGASVDEGPCSYTLEQLAAFVQANAGNPDVATALKGFKLSAVTSKQGLNDPAICRLLKDKKKLLGVTVVKH